MSLLQLSTCIVALVLLVSSQPTDDAQQPYSGARNLHQEPSEVVNEIAMVNSRLVDAVSRMQQENSQLVAANSQLTASLSELAKKLSLLHKDVERLKSNVNQQKNATTVCPTDFVYNATVNGCYKVMSVNREWSLAGLECRALHKDAHLLVISDAAEQAAVAQLIDATNETELSVCNRDSGQGIYFFTAGQRIDPNRNSPFVWRVESSRGCADSVSIMTYSNWHAYQPDYYNQRESCMNLAADLSHSWNDFPCHLETCFICELDM